MPTLIAFDSETFRFGQGNMAPRMVCASFASRNPQTGEIEELLRGNHQDDGLEASIEWLLTDEDLRIVTQDGAYDYAVICATWPRMIPLVFDLLMSGRATDTLWREKLINLSTTGRLEKVPLPDGTTKRISYSMAALAQSYLGVDLSDDKGNIEESWRANYQALDGWSACDYPEDAAEYAKSDARHTLRIYEAQDRRLGEWRMASVETEELQLLKSFVLRLMTAWGMEVNPEATDVMEAATIKVIEANRDLLEREGILRPMEGAVGPPYAADEVKAFELLYALFPEAELPAEIEDWSPYSARLRAQGIRFKKPDGKPGSRSMKRFQEYLAALYQRLGEIPSYTEGGERKPQIKCDAEVQEYLAGKDEVMAQYYERQALSKIVTQMIPALRSGPVVHPSYNALVETGRTSSYDGGKGKDGAPRLFGSTNIQNVPNLIKGLDPRQCFRPRDGTVFFDVDATGLELASVGHITYTLFGKSVHRDLYNEGVDLHGYLGAQLALNSPLDAHPLLGDFQSIIRDEGISSVPRAVYEAFKLLQTHDDEDVRKFFKHFRTFAKPVGLGFPGGLGPDTMVEFARKTYGVILTAEQATIFREFWRATYPEMVQFFNWVNGQSDQYNLGDKSVYAYTTPMGMVRRGASFCATANGMSMQSPGAEAALTGAALVSRACYDPTQESVLYGCRPIAFVHDQIIGETTRDQELWAPQCEEVARLFRVGMEMVLHTMEMRTDEALLTAVWSKSAEPVRNEEGILQVWKPE